MVASQPTILIADDTRDFVVSLANRFRSLGYTVAEARDGAETIELAKTARPTVILLDVLMPQLNGFQVCRRIKEDPQLSAACVVFLTVKDSEADRFWGMEVGADAYLTKPIDPGTIVLHVQQLLAG